MTGNSFGSNKTEEEIPIVWEQLETAKIALKRLATIEKFIKEFRGTNNDLEIQLKNIYGYIDECSYSLPLDDGSEQPIHTFWKGCFESLISMEIVRPKDEELSFYL